MPIPIFDQMSADGNFEIKLPQFEGPFDLLLFFIERDELDIHDISISGITNDFLDYLHRLSALNIEIASEFIFVVATLMRIKARMLLPRYEAEGEANEIDLKEELIRKLVEYKKFKMLCDELRPFEDERFKQERRGNIKLDLEQITPTANPAEELSTVTLYKLMLTYERLNKRWLNREGPVTHTVIQPPYTIERQKQAINSLLQINSRLDFKTLTGAAENKLHFVYNFLAVLEMLQQELVDIQIGLGFNNFWLSLR